MQRVLCEASAASAATTTVASAAAEVAAARADALRYNFLSCLILTAQNGFGRDVEPFLALCRETWGEEQLWAAGVAGGSSEDGPSWLPRATECRRLLLGSGVVGGLRVVNG